MWIDQSHSANQTVLLNVIGQFEIQCCVFGQPTWNLRYWRWERPGNEASSWPRVCVMKLLRTGGGGHSTGGSHAVGNITSVCCNIANECIPDVVLAKESYLNVCHCGVSESNKYIHLPCLLFSLLYSSLPQWRPRVKRRRASGGRGWREGGGGRGGRGGGGLCARPPVWWTQGGSYHGGVLAPRQFGPCASREKWPSTRVGTGGGGTPTAGTTLSGS